MNASGSRTRALQCTMLMFWRTTEAPHGRRKTPPPTLYHSPLVLREYTKYVRMHAYTQCLAPSRTRKPRAHTILPLFMPHISITSICVCVYFTHRMRTAQRTPVRTRGTQTISWREARAHTRSSSMSRSRRRRRRRHSGLSFTL